MSFLSSFFGRMVVLGAFLLVSISMFFYMLLQTGTQVPILRESPKTLTMFADNIDNLVPASQVQIAGVRIGEVMTSDATSEGGRVIFRVNSQYWPLHQGVHIRIGQRSLVGESYLDITDGKGEPIPEGTTLPREAIEPVVNLYSIYQSLDPQTRTETTAMLKSLGGATMQTKDGLSATMDGLSSLGRGGHTAIDAIAAQSEDLKKLTQETATLMRAFDTGEGQIAHMVSSANRVTASTAGQRPAFEEFWRLLPETLDNARNASASLRNLGGALAPVASDLRQAGPKLSDALVDLPGTSKDLRGLLPAANDTLNRAPDTLSRVSDFSDDLRDVIPAGRDMLADVDPVLHYLRPYGPDLAAFFANFNAALKPEDEAGRHFIRAQIYLNEKTLTSPTPLSLGNYVNPFPKPGAGTHPGPFTGKYPRLEQLPR